MGATLGGFMIAGGNPILLLHVSEFVTIGGISIGILLISTPAKVITECVKKTIAAIQGSAARKDDYLDLLKLLYEIFVLARRSLDPCVQPGPDELEKILKGLGK